MKASPPPQPSIGLFVVDNRGLCWTTVEKGVGVAGWRKSSRAGSLSPSPSPSLCSSLMIMGLAVEKGVGSARMVALSLSLSLGFTAVIRFGFIAAVRGGGGFWNFGFVIGATMGGGLPGSSRMVVARWPCAEGGGF
ncbi:hypothetical protein TIFTF001_053920 [Ficus carica]|uniref:Uncharacterized protein n=1 Tax=Ficus carica TaxID=3494 RepID=A0AA88EHF8_FICCA|nr:hypothetical protein TIFTF001_053919 [Ficus carica]GMN74790.1 hypothetical protein TIFTF001_053920 [Ficus carica]